MEVAKGNESFNRSMAVVMKAFSETLSDEAAILLKIAYLHGCMEGLFNSVTNQDSEDYARICSFDSTIRATMGEALDVLQKQRGADRKMPDVCMHCYCILENGSYGDRCDSCDAAYEAQTQFTGNW